MWWRPLGKEQLLDQQHDWLDKSVNFEVLLPEAIVRYMALSPLQVLNLTEEIIWGKSIVFYWLLCEDTCVWKCLCVQLGVMVS